MAPFSGRLYWYVIKEIVSLTLVIMAALSSVMFLFRLLAYSQYIFISQEGVLSILMFVLFLLPAIFKLTVPISLLLATTVTVLRMSSDRELEGWLSIGASPLRIAVGPFLIGIVVAGLSAVSALYLEPFSRQEWERFKYLHARKSVEGLIENRLQEKTFLSELFRAGDSDIAFYVDKLGAARTDLQGVFLSVTRKSEPFSMVLVAKEGSLKKEESQGLTDYVITLRDGKFYHPAEGSRAGGPVKLTGEGGIFEITPLPSPTATVDPDASLAAVGPTLPPGATPDVAPEPTPTETPLPTPTPTEIPWSERYVYPREWSVVEFREMRVSLLNMFSGQFDPGSFSDEIDIRSLYPLEYWRELRKLRASPEWGKNQRFVRHHSFFYEQIVVPFSCLLLPVLGVCLGIQDPRRKAGLAYLGLGIVVFVYYASIMICQQLALRFILPPEVTLVIPPVIILLVALVLLHWRMRYPPSVKFSEYLAIEARRLSGLRVRRGRPARVGGGK